MTRLIAVLASLPHFGIAAVMAYFVWKSFTSLHPNFLLILFGWSLVLVGTGVGGIWIYAALTVKNYEEEYLIVPKKRPEATASSEKLSPLVRAWGLAFGSLLLFAPVLWIGWTRGLQVRSFSYAWWNLAWAPILWLTVKAMYATHQRNRR